MSGPYYPANVCIYCLSPVYDWTDQTIRLTDEHIFPAAIGGTEILERASCKECQAKINLFETPFHEYLFPVRRFLNLGRRSRTRKSTHKYRYIIDGKAVDTFIDLSVIPASFTFAKMPGPPAIMMGKNVLGQSFPIKDIVTAIMNPNWKEMVIKTGGKTRFYSVSREDLARYVAKIAYVGACAEFGVDTFSSGLYGLIVAGDLTGVANFVGGRDGEVQADTLHVLSYDIQNGFLIGTIQLFAWMIGYTFEVVVGCPRRRFEVWSGFENKVRST